MQIALSERDGLPGAKEDVLKGATVFSQSDLAIGASVEVVKDNGR